MRRALLRGAAGATGVVRSLRHVAVTGAFLTVLVVVGSWLGDTDDHTRGQVVQAASTNLTNLAHHHWWTLFASAFVVTGDTGLRWLLGVGAVLAAGEVLWGGRRLVAVFLAGHVGATALVAAGLAIGVAHGWVPTTTLTATDVGVSYGVVAVAGALTSWAPRWMRSGWLLVWSVTLVEALLRTHTFTDSGHACAFTIGLAAGILLRARAGERAVPALPVGLLAAVGAYAYVTPSAGLCAGAAALTAAGLAASELRSWRRRVPMPAPLARRRVHHRGDHPPPAPTRAALSRAGSTLHPG